MKLQELLKYLKHRGVTLHAENEKLRYTSPSGAITPEILTELIKHKSEILEVLALHKELPEAGDTRAGIVPEERAYPLSLPQQRLWFLYQLEPESPVYNIFRAVRLKGNIKIAALEKGIRHIIKRHHILRTFFSDTTGTPALHVSEETGNVIRQVRLDRLNEARREEEAWKLAAEEEQRPFKLESGPPVRIVLIRMKKDELVLLLSVHHIVFDGWSLGVFFHELSRLYNAFSNGKVSPLDELPIQYTDYSAWHRNWLKGELLDKQIAFWKTQLKDLATLELPLDRPRPSVQTFNGARHTFELSHSLTASLKELSRKERVTLFMTLFTAFQVLLHKYTGQDDIVVGTPNANRNRAEIEGLIGFFVNTMVIRGDISGNPEFSQLLKKTRKNLLDIYSNQDLPFEKLVEALKPARDMSRNPLFQVSFALQNVPFSTLQFAGLDASIMEIGEKGAKFDLEFYLEEDGGRLKGSVVYNTDLFNTDTVRRMAHHYSVLLEEITDHPDHKLSELPLMTPADQHEMLHTWNSTAYEYPQHTFVHELFEDQARTNPGATAIVHRDRTLRYGELNSRANRLARHLSALGVGPEVKAGICIERSIEFIISMLAVLKAGGAYVPLDPSYPEERLSFMAEDSAMSVLITTEQLSPSFTNVKTTIVCVDRDRDEISRQSDRNPNISTSAENLAYVIYTSGSTGRPKGVMISNGNLAGFILSYQPVVGDEKRTGTSVAPFSFDTSVDEIYSAICFGGTLHIMMPEDITDAEYFARYLIEHKITTSYIVPDMLPDIASCLEGMMDQSSLQCLITGLKPKKEWTLQKFRDLSDSLRILNSYGPTEVTYGATAFEFTNASEPDRDVPIGRPFPNYKVYIVDKHLNPVPVGVPGELLIGGTGLARGYLNRPELTDAKFIQDPFSSEPGARLYRTGDRVTYRPDGNIEFLGRFDDQVKIRGYRIEPGEVAQTLKHLPAMKEALVVAREDRVGNQWLAAYVVLKEGRDMSISDIKKALIRKLPEYMIPAGFVKLDSMPLLPNGKVNKNRLPEPELSRSDMDTPYVAPGTDLERLLAAIWRDILGINKIGIDDSFFEMGGHSLLATKVISRIRNRLQMDVPLRLIFDHPTVAGLSESINGLSTIGESPEEKAGRIVADAQDIGENVSSQHNGDTDSSAPLEVLVPRKDRNAPIPLSFSQQRLWFLTQLEPDSSAYNITHVLRLTGKLHISAIERSIAEIIRRHEVLRTVFRTVNNEQVQVLQPPSDFKIKRVDMSGASEPRRKENIDKLLRDTASGLFDLTQGPLLRAILIRTDKDEHLLVLSTHHIVSDAWSTGIFYHELSTLYEAFSQNKVSPLSELPVQYADFTLWQHQWLRGNNLDNQLRFWKNQLDDLTTLALPIDRPRPAVQTYRGAKVPFRLNTKLIEKLRKLSHREHVTLFMTMLAAFQALLHRYTGQEDIVIGTPIANRPQAETHGLIGFFLNTLVVRADISGDPSFMKMLAGIRRYLLDAYTYQDLPFEKLVEELKPERDLSRNPLFQVLFTLRDSSDLELKLAGLDVSQVELETARTRFDLEVHLTEDGQGLKGTFIYNTDLFNDSTIERMTGHYEKIIEGITADPDQRLSDLPLLIDSEKQQLLVDWNRTSAEFPRERCVHHLFEEAARDYADEAAVIYSDRQLTYRELNSRANHLAGRLMKNGAGPDIPVGIYLERSPEMILAVLAILKAGAAYVPFDPSYPKERIRFMIEDSGISYVVTRTDMTAELPNSAVRTIVLDDNMNSSGHEYKDNPETAVSPHNLAYLLYTSGSTGTPKGVAMSHQPLCNLISWQTGRSHLSPGSKTMQFASLNFDVSFQEIFSTLCSGGTLMLASEELRRDPIQLCRFLAHESVERIFLPFVALQQLAEAIDKGAHVPSNLKEVITAGEQLRITPSVKAMFEKLKSCGLFNQYGPTESHVVTEFSLSGDPGSWPSLPPIGRPVSNSNIFILDRFHKPVPAGIPGELWIGGACLARGYMNRPDLTAERFMTGPFTEAADTRLYRTGDLARYLPDGNIEYLGRIDNQVKVRGFRIEPGEIETVLAEHADVRDAVVTATGKDAASRRLAAYILCNERSSMTSDEVRHFLGERLPDYMVPSLILFLDRLPLTPSGKVDRKALPEPTLHKDKKRDAYVPPGDSLEERLTGIWERVLDIHPIGMTDNFFQLGGHSLLAVSVILEINRVTGKKLPVMSIFHAPTIAQLVETIRNEESSAHTDTIVPVQPEGSKAPVIWITGTNFIRHLDHDQPVYILIEWEEHGFIPRFSTIEDIADHYIKKLLRERPEGPYILGGYCFWGAIALEVAGRLRRMGHEVPLLFLLSTSVQYRNKRRQKKTVKKKGSIQRGWLVEQAGILKRLSTRDRLLYLLQKVPSAAKTVCSRFIDRLHNKIKVTVCKSFLYFGRPVPVALRPYYVSNVYAMKLLGRYIARDYQGKVVLINTGSDGKTVRPDWIDLAQGEVSVHTLQDVHHIDMINEPQVEKWSQILNRYLHEINK